MKSVLKSLLILVLIIAAGAGVYLGALLPLAKAQSFIAAQQNINSVKTTDDLKTLYDPTLTMWSPIGQEEVVKFAASTIQSILTQQKSLPEDASRWLVSYMEPFLFKDELRHLDIQGDMYQFLWANYGHKDADFAKAEQYFLSAYAIGPKVPPVLYRLISLYYLKGDKENTEKYATIVVSLWPDDTQTQSIVNAIASSSSATTTKK